MTRHAFQVAYEESLDNQTSTFEAAFDSSWCPLCRSEMKTCENLLSYSWINYFSATSITRTKMIFHSTNIFVNLVKLMQRVKMGEEKERTMFF
jgi:prepilin signal peptidase PulO-like enzyme (type II secretory pathway)